MSSTDDQATGEGCVAQQLSELTDLFRRRILDDRDKRRALDELAEDVRFAREGLARQYLAPLVREVLLVVDRASALDSDHAHSVADELVGVLGRYGVTPVEDRGVFDPLLHEAARSSVADGETPGTIAEVERPGYRYGDMLIRPARVVVWVDAARHPVPDEPAT